MEGERLFCCHCCQMVYNTLQTFVCEFGVRTAVMEKLQPVATAASIAMDECDFGTSLELGIDLFCSGHSQLHSLITSLLVQAYSMLHRPQYIAIAKAHLERREKSIHLSIFELDK